MKFVIKVALKLFDKVLLENIKQKRLVEIECSKVKCSKMK